MSGYCPLATIKGPMFATSRMPERWFGGGNVEIRGLKVAPYAGAIQ
jgi:hypothetical protein